MRGLNSIAKKQHQVKGFCFVGIALFHSTASRRNPQSWHTWRATTMITQSLPFNKTRCLCYGQLHFRLISHTLCQSPQSNPSPFFIFIFFLLSFCSLQNLLWKWLLQCLRCEVCLWGGRSPCRSTPTTAAQQKCIVPTLDLVHPSRALQDLALW